MEISYIYKKENLRALDINNWIDNNGDNLHRKKGFRAHYRYLKKKKLIL